MEINTNNKVVDINSLQPNEYNPKINYRDNEDNKKEFEKLKESLKLAGQIQPVIVREVENEGNVWYEIVNGYHRWEAMREMGYEKVEIKNLGKIDFDTAVSRALLTEDIKVPIDSLELAGLMKDLVTDEKPAGYWAELLPYDQELIESKLELLDFDFNEYDDKGDSDSESNLNYTFKFKNKEELAKVKAFFSTYEKDEQSDVLYNMVFPGEINEDANISEDEEENN